MALKIIKTVIGGKETAYLLLTRRGMKRINLTAHSNGLLRLSKPPFVSQKQAEKFIKEREEWIIQKTKGNTYFDYLRQKREEKEEYLKRKKEAEKIIVKEARDWLLFYNLSARKITIGNQRSRWGSCSARGNLHFNYKVSFLPPRERTYVIVHEVCHLKEMNHGKRFWELVSKAVPEYKEIRKKLQKIQ